MEPNHEDLWSININNVMQTNGFARDVTIYGDNAIVAAGQSGVQVWNLNSNSLVKSFLGYEEGGTFLEFDDLAVIG